jgi:hypothetical protein
MTAAVMSAHVTIVHWYGVSDDWGTAIIKDYLFVADYPGLGRWS